MVAPHRTLATYYADDDSRQRYLNELFDRNAAHYDAVGGVLAMGSGGWYRRKALLRAGVTKDSRVLDVATGTGLVAQAALDLGVAPHNVVGLDPSAGMLRQNQRGRAINLVRGIGERLPFPDASFDHVVMGYALRHVDDLERAFREFHRVLRPDGTALALEITRPQSRLGRFFARSWIAGIVPVLTKLRIRGSNTSEMMRYYWSTIDECVAPELVTGAMDAAGFRDVRRGVQLGIFSEYTGTR